MHINKANQVIIMKKSPSAGIGVSAEYYAAGVVLVDMGDSTYTIVNNRYGKQSVNKLTIEELFNFEYGNFQNKVVDKFLKDGIITEEEAFLYHI